VVVLNRRLLGQLDHDASGVVPHDEVIQLIGEKCCRRQIHRQEDGWRQQFKLRQGAPDRLELQFNAETDLRRVREPGVRRA
jgi:hypothetical protein